MTKWTFVLLKENSEGFLEKLQELGVMDITRSTKSVDEASSALLDRIALDRKALALLAKADYSADPDAEAIFKEAKETYADPSDTPANDIIRISEEISAVEAQRLQALKDAASRRQWGEFDPAWAELYPLEVIAQEGKKTWLVAVSSDGEDYSFPVPECAGPELPSSHFDKNAASAKMHLVILKARIEAMKALAAELEKEIAKCTDSLDIHFAGASGIHAVENKVVAYEGFSLTSDEESIAAALGGDDLYFEKAPAVKEDNPPVKLRNNWFARQFEGLTGMYGMPLYDEWDPTPILAPFFLLFFSLCMGDAGYGILLIVLAYLFKGMKGEGPMGLAKSWNLIRSLGAGTLVVGFFLGTFFGIDLYTASWVPDALKGCMLKGEVLGYDVQMVLALGIGVFHLCLAMIVKSALYTQRFGFKETISTWGWTLLIVGGLVALGVCTAAAVPLEITKWIVIGIAGVSALAIFIFNKIGRNPLLNIGAGLWDTYQMVTGLLGDVLSYIRLYALGLAGGMLGGAFNNLGDMVLGTDPTWQWLPFVLILAFGHALNLAMSCLGAYVHPLRLTFVEYFKNSGYEGKGTKFSPLKKA